MLDPIPGVERLVHRTDARGEGERFTHRPTESPLEVVQGNAAYGQGRQPGQPLGQLSLP